MSNQLRGQLRDSWRGASGTRECPLVYRQLAARSGGVVKTTLTVHIFINLKCKIPIVLIIVSQFIGRYFTDSLSFKEIRSESSCLIEILT